MALSDQGRAALTYWAQIQAAASERGNTAGAFERINEARASGGTANVPVTMLGVGEVYSAAAAIRNASESFTSARAVSDEQGLDQGITAAMISTAPWSRPDDQMQALAQYTVRFDAQMTSPLGQPFTQTLTMVFPGGALPATVGELVDALAEFAPASGSLGDGSFDGVGDVSILAV